MARLLAVVMALGMAIPTGAGGTVHSQGLVAAVNRVIDRRDITTVFQPLVDLSTAAVVGYEALTRGPAGSAIEAPLTLLAGAQLAGRLDEFDWMCAARACDAVVEARLHPSMTTFLNIKPSTILAACPEDLRPSVRRAQNNLRIVIDMDEEALTDDPASLFDAVAAVRGSVWGIAIDDAAAAPAALALLPLVRPDVLKLDLRGLKGQLGEIAKMGEGARVYSEQTGATILAQGIEDLDDVSAARLTGATFGQGWFFGRPGPLPSEGLVPTSVFPLVQRSPVADRASPFEVVSERCRTTIIEKRFLVPFIHHIEDQVDGHGPRALLLESFEPGSTMSADEQARLRHLGDRAAFFAGLSADLSGFAMDGPSVRTGTVSPADRIGSEWDVIVLGPHYAVAVTARAIDSTLAGNERRFDYAVTHDRDLVVRAALVMWGRLPGRGHEAPP